MSATKENDYRQTILDVGTKYLYNEKHALFAEDTALKLFDSLATTRSFNEVERTLLSHASLLHDIGNCISEKKHHKHSKYLIDHDENLLNYPAKDKNILSLVAYNHRKKLHKEVELLSKKEKEMVLRLSAILRIADSLDYTRDEVSIKKVILEKLELKITIDGVLPERLNDRLLRKKGLFMEIFKLDVTLEV